MRYMAENGEVFDSESECIDYEEIIGDLNLVYEKIDRFLDIKGNDELGERIIAKSWIVAWVKHDARKNPHRYKDKESS